MKMQQLPNQENNAITRKLFIASVMDLDKVVSNKGYLFEEHVNITEINMEINS